MAMLNLCSLRARHMCALVVAMAAAAAPAHADGDLTLAPFGFLRLKGAVIADDPNVAFVGRNDGFILQNARAGVLGRYREWLSFKASADGAVDERQGANATSGVLRFALKDFYADFTLVPQLAVRAGRFQIIF